MNKSNWNMSDCALPATKNELRIYNLHMECWQIMWSARIFLDLLYDAKPFSIEKCIRPHFIMLSLQYAILLFFWQKGKPKGVPLSCVSFSYFQSFLRCATNNIQALAFLICVSLHATFYILQFTYTHLLLSHITSLLFIVLNSAQSKVCKCFTIQADLWLGGEKMLIRR